jgi:hypothetical protein
MGRDPQGDDPPASPPWAASPGVTLRSASDTVRRMGNAPDGGCSRSVRIALWTTGGPALGLAAPTRSARSKAVAVRMSARAASARRGRSPVRLADQEDEVTVP